VESNANFRFVPRPDKKPKLWKAEVSQPRKVNLVTC
jgi:hypothetical protein